MNEKMVQFKILVFTVPASGHVNPLLPILNELNKLDNIEIIVYLTEEFRKKIENIGIKFRALKNFDIVKKADLKPFGKKRHFELLDLMTLSLQGIANNFDFIAQEIDTEQPNLIIYDTWGIHVKWAVRYYMKCYDNAQKRYNYKKRDDEFRPTWPMPPMIGFSATFVYNENIYPNNIEESMMIPYNFRFFYDLFRLFLTSFRIGIQYGIGFMNPMNHIKMKLDAYTKMIVSCIFPELHPRSHLYDKDVYKFIGTTVEEDVINQIYLDQMKEEPFKSLFDLFPVKERNISSSFLDQGNSPRLVYASLGTLFNNNFEIYKKIIDTFISLSNDNLRVVVSTGEKVELQFKELIESKKFILPDNIKIVKSAPQVEILKRASLFITHCGMNSTSESIHFAGKYINPFSSCFLIENFIHDYFSVPMVCIPLSEDQPLNAYRVADELGLGIRLDYTKMDTRDIQTAVKHILGDNTYSERVQMYSQISRKYNGYSNAAKVIYEFLLNKNK